MRKTLRVLAEITIEAPDNSTYDSECLADDLRTDIYGVMVDNVPALDVIMMNVSAHGVCDEG